jgi:hypothetical protein
MHCMKAAELMTDAFFFRKGCHGCFFLLIQLPSHAKTGCAIMVSITCCTPCFLPCTNRAAQCGRPSFFSRSRTNTQTVIVKLMIFYDWSTKIIKSMIIEKKTTTLSSHLIHQLHLCLVKDSDIWCLENQGQDHCICHQQGLCINTLGWVSILPAT